MDDLKTLIRSWDIFNSEEKRIKGEHDKISDTLLEVSGKVIDLAVKALQESKLPFKRTFGFAFHGYVYNVKTLTPSYVVTTWWEGNGIVGDSHIATDRFFNPSDLPLEVQTKILESLIPYLQERGVISECS